jgi:pyridoxine kinase
MTYPKILTIQDISCVGQCSLTVALPILSAAGVETCILPSAVLSTHTAGFSGFTVRDLTEDIPAIAAHWRKEKIAFDAVYTGYLGSTEQIADVKNIFDTLLKPGALTIVDPAMADNGRLYAGFADDFPMEMRRLCEAADYILPNLTEAAFLLGRKPVLEGYDEAFVLDMLKALHAIGAKNVVLTGVSFAPDKLGVATYDGEKAWFYFNDRLPLSTHGTGDLYASVFAGAMLRGKGMDASAALAADVVCDSLSKTPKSHWYGTCFESAIPYLVSRLA